MKFILCLILITQNKKAFGEEQLQGEEQNTKLTDLSQKETTRNSQTTNTNTGAQDSNDAGNTDPVLRGDAEDDKTILPGLLSNDKVAEEHKKVLIVDDRREQKISDSPTSTASDIQNDQQVLKQIAVDGNNKKAKFSLKINIISIACNDFIDSFFQCCVKDTPATQCNNTCESDISIVTNTLNFQKSVVLEASNPEKNNIIYVFKSDNLNSPLYLTVTLYFKDQPTVIDEWVIVSYVLNNIDREFVSKGINNKCTLKMNLRLSCEDFIGLGCQFSCNNLQSNEGCDPVKGEKICKFSFGGDSCVSEFKASNKLNQSALVGISFALSILVNAVALASFIVIRKYAKFKGWDKIEKLAQKYVFFDDEFKEE